MKRSHSRLSRLLASLCLVGLLVSAFPEGQAADATAEHAYILNDLNLFQGTDAGFELDKRPTRVEGMTMFVRLLGGEEEANARRYSHPFDDVPSWGDPYVGYAWEHGLTNGISENTFGSTAYITLEEYVTFVLRALGYDDKAGDFAWNTSVDKAVDIGMLTRGEADKFFGEVITRGNMVDVSYAALTQTFKDGSRTLAEKLVEDEVFSRELAMQKGLLPGNVPTPTPTPIPTPTPAPVPKYGWLFLINYTRTVKDGRMYNAIVDGKLVEITTNEKEVLPVPNVYGYTLEGDLYDLDGTVYNDYGVQVGEVTLIDRKSLIINDNSTGTEARITAETVTALLDDEDTELDTFVGKGDVVYLVTDRSGSAVGIFVLAEYDDTQSDIVAHRRLAQEEDGVYRIGSSTGLTHVEDVKGLFVPSGRSALYWFADGTVTEGVSRVDADIEGISESGSVQTGTYQLVVVSESAQGTDSTDGYSVYPVVIE